MTKDELSKLMTRIFEECQKTREDGQREYAHDSKNAFGNFGRIAAELGLKREDVWYVYAKKHWDGILSYIRGHKSQREDVRGRLKDLIVYSVILWGMVEENESPTQFVDTDANHVFSVSKATFHCPAEDCKFSTTLPYDLLAHIYANHTSKVFTGRNDTDDGLTKPMEFDRT